MPRRNNLNALPLTLLGLGAGWLLITGLRRTETWRRWEAGAIARAGELEEAAEQKLAASDAPIARRAGEALHSLREGAARLREKAGGEANPTTQRAKAGAGAEASERSTPPSGDWFGRDSVDYDLRSMADTDWIARGAETARRSFWTAEEAVERGVKSGADNVRHLVEEYPLAASLVSFVVGAALVGAIPALRRNSGTEGEGTVP